MCRTVHAVLSMLICTIQMLARVFMTVLLMIENVIRMILQTLYNFISFMMQMVSLIPICVVFLLTSKLKCLMCGGGWSCPGNRGGACDCIMSLLAIIILFFIFRATGVLDKIFNSMGYAKSRPQVASRFVQTPGDTAEYPQDTEYTLTSIEMEEKSYELTVATFMSTELSVIALDDIAKNVTDETKTTVNAKPSLAKKQTTTLDTVKTNFDMETSFIRKLTKNFTTILYEML